MSILEPLKWALTVILIWVAVYITFRILFAAIFKSYFEEKNVFSVKKSIDKILTTKLKESAKEKKND